MTARIALGIEYDGGAFNGWQRQSHQPSVQSELEAALSQVADRPVRTVGAGRTDAGVHATGQVASFQTDSVRPVRAWRDGVNALTSAGVKVRWAREVDAEFNARFSAIARRYLYLYRVDAGRSPLTDPFTWRSPPLEAPVMHRAAQALLGEQDFTSFRAASCQSKSPCREVRRIEVRCVADLVVLDIEANAFVLRMVRNVAGALAQVGRGERPDSWIAECLQAKDRALIGRTAPPQGLFLVEVTYPGWDFPASRPPPPLAALSTGLSPR
ncbi:MAG: tRNA pseudouridine(38-40) synthase TruA [Gammaproteobacteria bacterium]|nr:tRNA pseudouridine(38-40) synthase TruA [Gammaproteobacteria bacterium]